MPRPFVAPYLEQLPRRVALTTLDGVTIGVNQVLIDGITARPPVVGSREALGVAPTDVSQTGVHTDTPHARRRYWDVSVVPIAYDSEVSELLEEAAPSGLSRVGKSGWGVGDYAKGTET